MAYLNPANFSPENYAAIVNLLATDALDDEQATDEPAIVMENPVPMEETAEQVERVVAENVERSSNFLIYNFLSADYFQKSVLLPTRISVYLFGSIGYAFSLVPRIVIFIVTFVNLVIDFFKTLYNKEYDKLSERLKFRGIICLGAVGEIASAGVGVFCPNLGYKCDAKIQSNKMIHDWYSKYGLSLWYYEWSGYETNPNDIGFGSDHPFPVAVVDYVVGPIIEYGNENRLELKRQRAESSLQFFAMAKEDLYRFLHENEIISLTPHVLFTAAVLGSLHALLNGDTLAFINPKDEVKASNSQGTTNSEEIADSEEVSDGEEAIDSDEISDSEEVSDGEEAIDSDEISDSEEVSDGEKAIDSEETTNSEPIEVISKSNQTEKYAPSLKTLLQLLNTLSQDSSKTLALSEKKGISPPQLEYEGPLFSEQEMTNLILLELMLQERNPKKTADAEYFKEGTLDEIKRLLSQTYLTEEFLLAAASDPLSEKKILSYFNLLPLEAEGAELTEKGKTVEEAKDQTTLEERELIMVTYGEKSMPLRNLITQIVLELKTFTEEWYLNDREMGGVIGKAIFMG